MKKWWWCRTTWSCQHKALPSRPGLDPIEKDLQIEGQLTFGEPEWSGVLPELIPNQIGGVLGLVYSGGIAAFN